MTSSSQTPPELLESLNRPVPMPVAQAARVIEDDYAKALTDVRRYARQLDIVPDNIAEENEQTHAQDNDLAKKRVLYRQAGLFKIRREFLENKATIGSTRGIESFQQDHTRVGQPGRIDCCQRHRIWIYGLVPLRFR